MSRLTKDPKLTPMMRQYFEIKNQHPDKYLFFRLGDFYEIFDKDAVEVSSLLQITLTERNHIAMCGIPHHQLHRYAHKVIAQGKKIVIVEQDEKPAPGSTIFTRKVSRIITPGTTIDEMNLSAKEKNFIISFYFSQEGTLFTEGYSAGLTALETTTGEVIFETVSDTWELQQALTRFFENYSPTEIVIPESYRQKNMVAMLVKDHPHLIVNYLPDPQSDQVKKKLSTVYRFLGKEIPDFTIPRFESNYRGLYLLLTYTEGNYGETIDYLQLPREVDPHRFLVLDQQTLVHLELFKNNYDHTRKHSLLSIIDYTRTPMGARKLQEHLTLPSRERKVIEERLDRIDFFSHNPLYLKEVRGWLHNVSDIERIITRLALRRILPRDFLSLKRSLDLVHSLFLSLSQRNPVWLDKIDAPGLSGEKRSSHLTRSVEEISQRIDKTIAEEPNNDLTKGDFIKPAIHPQLQEYHRIRTQAENLLSNLELREKRKTGISTLKIRYKDNLGYFFETGKSSAEKVPDHFIRKQSLVSAERFVSEELLQLDSQIKEARENSVHLEREIFEELRKVMVQQIPFLQEISHFVARIDVAAGFAELASIHRWCRPVVSDGEVLRIKGGRHPVVEKDLEDPFIPNDITIGTPEDRIQIITGPNMSGKSTFLRQNALIVILTHLGCFVPAESAEVPICDQVFTRIGSGDRLFQGESTFLVEMKETARILDRMTPKSLVIMDEIGRGTSTYDGLALAWSILEYINRKLEKRAKTLFATHYHELISLTREEGITHYHVSIREEGDRIIFLKKVVQGRISRSYGIQVAQLAGLPEEVVGHARTLLQELEKKQVNPDELSRKIRAGEVTEDNSPSSWEKEIIDFDISDRSPLEISNFLRQLQKNILRKHGH